MSKFTWQDVVIEDRIAAVTHYGQTGPIRATTLSEAQAEVDRFKPLTDPRSAPCCRILEGDRVVSTRMFDRDSHRVRWS